MPYFQIILSGKEIDFRPAGTTGDAFTGFFVTCVVKANSLNDAHQTAKERLLESWRPGGRYALHNRGAIPTLAVEGSRSVAPLMGLLLSQQGPDYAFYQQLR